MPDSKLRLNVGSAVTGTTLIAPASILIDGDKIVAVDSPERIGETAGTTVITHDDLCAVPGFVDLQINGFGDCDFASCDRQSFLRATQELLSIGTTAICPTLISAPLEAYPQALSNLGRSASSDHGSRILGVHLEGPFIEPHKRGAHPRSALLAPAINWVEQLLQATPVQISIMTLAPELDGADQLIKLLVSHGVVASVGHSQATYSQTVGAFAAGASMVTHLFNAQPPFHHRQPGLVGAALTTDLVSVGLILDLVHVDRIAAQIALELLGERAFLVSDAVVGAGDTSPAPITVPGTQTLAGGAVGLDRGFAHAARMVGVERAARLWATRPAAAVGRNDLGSLAPGKLADIALVDAEFAVRGVLAGGVPIDDA